MEMQVQKRIYNYIIEVQNFVFVGVTNGKRELEKKAFVAEKNIYISRARKCDDESCLLINFLVL